jgi:hypothetical protein
MQAVFAGNDWYPSWVADAAGDCAQDDALHAGGVSGIGCAAQPEQTRAMLSRGPLEKSVLVVRDQVCGQSSREEDMP